ncbi:septum site-determining protein MinC [Helicobacter cynogastricus]|uniref:septum site-determining protein MinC n=1 Tax=Helicobacter cynogastricus TaxID=329937 RepID=UPI0018F83ED8|nr:septum site-determining protein MinC [Helicobacter cynogastricus]
MLQTRQKQVRCFELSVANKDQYLNFIYKNAPLLQDYLLLFKTPLEKEVLEALERHGLAYSVCAKDLKGKNSNQVVIYDAIDFAPQNTTPSPPLEGVQIYERHVRSGEEISSPHSLIFLGNINHGAKIHSEQNISIYGHCEGIIICMGACMVLKSVHSSYIAFQGAILNQAQLERINASDKLKLITKKDDIISIKDIP